MSQTPLFPLSQRLAALHLAVTSADQFLVSQVVSLSVIKEGGFITDISVILHAQQHMDVEDLHVEYGSFLNLELLYWFNSLLRRGVAFAAIATYFLLRDLTSSHQVVLALLSAPGFLSAP